MVAKPLEQDFGVKGKAYREKTLEKERKELVSNQLKFFQYRDSHPIDYLPRDYLLKPVPPWWAKFESRQVWEKGKETKPGRRIEELGKYMERLKERIELNQKLIRQTTAALGMVSEYRASAQMVEWAKASVSHPEKHRVGIAREVWTKSPFLFRYLHPLIAGCV
ncbi:hypothetical protein QBC36DRAFT_285232 [Triangularia setosa]|uniref:Uncharacterized protein n=1 Tax=Triangularia setosa TaxID=2587417 RepID=A0AAN6WGY9_9PEZI|nr:hypothetical protein QBC36DRAFT_285232 [Podospora setosa]